MTKSMYVELTKLSKEIISYLCLEKELPDICSKCGANWLFEMYHPEYTECGKCANPRWRYRKCNKTKIMEYNKTYYQEHKEELKEGKKKYKNEYVERSVCKCSVHKHRQTQHNETLKHQRNITNNSEKQTEPKGLANLYAIMHS